MSDGGAAPDRSLAGRTALVTGASRGIGAAVAVRLARAGAAVAVTARTLDEDPASPLAGSLGTTLAAIEAEGARGVAVVADLADGDDRQRVVPEVAAALGPVDILVNNAAAAIYAPATEMPLRRRRLLFEVNVHAPVDLAQAVVPSMRERGAGWIINVSSATSRTDRADGTARVEGEGLARTPYGASKAALERYTTGLAAELAPDGIAVNAVAPVAAVRTPGAVAVLAGRLDDRPDLFEPVDDLADAIWWLAHCDHRLWSGRVLTSRDVLTEARLR